MSVIDISPFITTKKPPRARRWRLNWWRVLGLVCLLAPWALACLIVWLANQG